MTLTAPVALNADQIAHFHREGFVILEHFVETEVLPQLQAICDEECRRKDEELAAKGMKVDGITHYKKRYFIAHAHDHQKVLRDFAFGPAMAAVVKSVLSPTAQLFLEQFVVKGSDDPGTKFGWHQDSGYVGYPHAEYLTCWLALDDMVVANGTIRVLPWTRVAGNPREIPEHMLEAGTNDKIGYFGVDPGDPVLVPAGTLVVFSSRTFHQSTANTTRNFRRAWIAQYTQEPLYRPDGELQIRAEPFLENGVIIAR